MKSAVIQVVSRPGAGAAQARITSSNVSSTEKRQLLRRAVRMMVRCAFHEMRSKTARGSGDHQVTFGFDDQGNTPLA